MNILPLLVEISLKLLSSSVQKAFYHRHKYVRFWIFRCQTMYHLWFQSGKFFLTYMITMQLPIAQDPDIILTIDAYLFTFCSLVSISIMGLPMDVSLISYWKRRPSRIVKSLFSSEDKQTPRIPIWFPKLSLMSRRPFILNLYIFPILVTSNHWSAHLPTSLLTIPQKNTLLQELYFWKAHSHTVALTNLNPYWKIKPHCLSISACWPLHYSRILIVILLFLSRLYYL